MALDESQKQAVNHNKGPAMILAGPGSGKTTVITHRLKQLAEVHGVNPGKILVITFTKMAAVQMKERYLKLCNAKNSDITFGTFHAVFFMILRSVCGYKASDIVKTSEQRALIKMQLMARGINVQDESAFIHDVMSEIAKVKGMNVDVESYEANSCDRDLFKEFYVRYDELLKNERKVDFEDMMVSTLNVLKTRKDVLSIWQNRYEYILVDEFQDAAPVQFDIVRLLGEKHNNIFVVGDDDQSIYGFRGAAPDVMKAFEREYKDVKIYHLSMNYRCSGNIVKAATHIINQNKNRFYKDLKAFNHDGEKVRMLRCRDVSGESEQIAVMVEEYLRENEGNIAILTRTHSGAKEIVTRLQSRGINISQNSKSESVYNHWIALDIVAYIKIALGSDDRGDYMRVINKPLRYIDRMFFDKPRVCQEQVIKAMELVGQKELAKVYSEFYNDLRLVRGMPPFAGFNYIFKKMGYERYLMDYSKENGTKYEELTKIVGKLADSIKDCESYEMWLELVKNDSATENDAKYKMHKNSDMKNDNSQESRVIINTMHGAKGLEYDTVIIPDVNEGITPYSKAVTESGLEEERRLFYVAMTRAKTRLIIVYADERYNKYVQPSRYARELHHHKSCI